MIDLFSTGLSNYFLSLVGNFGNRNLTVKVTNVMIHYSYFVSGIIASKYENTGKTEVEIKNLSILDYNKRSIVEI